jgi:spermidine synthase
MYLETFLISLAAILLEVSYTRIFSFKLVYYFSYVIIGVALLGLGSGGVLIATFPRLRRGAGGRLLPWCCALGALVVLAGYLVIAEIPLNLFRLLEGIPQGNRENVVGESAKLLVVCVAVFLPFLAAGLALAAIFATHAKRIARLYFADLIGAGLGCAICVPLMATITPPGCVLLVGVLFALAGLRLSSRQARFLLAPLGLLALAGLAGVAMPGRLPDVTPDKIKLAPAGFFYRWNPVFRVDLVPMPGDNFMFLVHDGTRSAGMHRWDGKQESLAEFEFGKSDRSYPFRLLPPKPRVAIIGSAGGHEILASLYFDAGHVTAIELNPVTVSLLRSEFADFSGHFAENPRVTLLNAEGRSFLASSNDRFDLIWLVAPDTYAAMNAATSGAFVLSESYLYTREMIVEALEHLSDDGILCAQFGEISFDEKPNRTARYLGTAREAFQQLGIDDFERHVLVNTSPAFGRLESTAVLLKRTPFTAADVERFRAATAAVDGARIRFAWTDPHGTDPISQVISLRGDAQTAWYDSYKFDVAPIADDGPFFWHFVRFRDAIGGSLPSHNLEEGIGERLLILLLCLVTLFATIMLLVPVLTIRRVWAAIPYKLRASAYFAALGMGFMFLEISLIQRITLLLGYPTYSLTVTLFSLLTATGIGSLASERYVERRDAALLWLGLALIVLVVFDARFLPRVVDVGVSWPFAARVALAIAALAPLGLCLGAFMPLGLRTVAATTPYAEEFVAWSWAVNGFFSVVSSVLATILAMAVGLERVMLLGLAVYLVGILAMLSIPAPKRALG